MMESVLIAAVSAVQAYLLGIDFEETAQMIADKVNSAAPDLTNES